MYLFRKSKRRSKIIECFKSAERGTSRRKTRMAPGVGIGVASSNDKFIRRFRLPENVKTDLGKASVENGLLLFLFLSN
ncbi:hypothetical protein V6N13_130599 [Hibiscus sabdariffa]